MKRGEATPAEITEAVEVMAELNAGAAGAVAAVGVHAATDVTGFGLLGHLGEMLQASGAAAGIELGAIPFLKGARRLAAAGIVPGGTKRNLQAAQRFTRFGDTPDPDRLLLADAQTSGGLLIAAAAVEVDRLVAALTSAGTPAAAVIGEITGGEPGTIFVTS